jgi:hypothetical protein
MALPARVGKSKNLTGRILIARNNFFILKLPVVVIHRSARILTFSLKPSFALPSLH